MKSSSTPVRLNRITTAGPPHDVHRKFLEYVRSMLADKREQRMSARLSDTAQIEHLHAVIQLSTEPRQVDAVNFYRRGRFPSTAPHFEFPYVVFSE